MKVSQPIIDKIYHRRKRISGRNHAAYTDQVQKNNKFNMAKLPGMIL